MCLYITIRRHAIFHPIDFYQKNIIHHHHRIKRKRKTHTSSSPSSPFLSRVFFSSRRDFKFVAVLITLPLFSFPPAPCSISLEGRVRDAQVESFRAAHEYRVRLQAIRDRSGRSQRRVTEEVWVWDPELEAERPTEIMCGRSRRREAAV